MDWNTIVSIFTILAFYLAWTAFVFDRNEKRDTQKFEKKDILVSIQKELELMSGWLGTSYSNQVIDNGMKTWHPFDMVYSLGGNQATRNAISFRSVTLLSENLAKLLVLFNQLLSNFEQQAERVVNFNMSNSIAATTAFYIHDRILMKGRSSLWAYMNSLYKKINKGINLKPAEIQLVGTNRMFRDLHVIGIGDENQTNPISLRRAYLLLTQLVDYELDGLNKEKQFIEPKWIRIMNIIIYLVLPIILGLWFLNSIWWKGGVTINMNLMFITAIFVLSFVLGLVKFYSLDLIKDKNRNWQLNFVEIWNCSFNFLIAGLVGSYFVFYRWPYVVGGNLIITDFVLLAIFVMGIFGHLNVLSFNLTNGIEAILSRVLLERKGSESKKLS